jgi:pimeloyl-ACP methyl ester carboxylesterase
MPTIEVNGARLSYVDAGTGPALVFLHAGIADLRMWQRQLPDLAADHRAVAYDLRGYGDSDLPPGPFAHHDDLAPLLDALGIDGAVLVGCSLGGMVAVDCALAHPDRVRGLVLVGAGLSGYKWSAEFRELWRNTVGLAGDDLDAAAEAEVGLWVVGPDRTRDAVDDDVLRLATAMNRRALEREAQLEEQEPTPLDPPAVGRLGEVTAPTLVTTGTADVPEIHAIADLLVAGIAGAVRVDVPDAGHLLPLERPDEFTRVLRHYLRSR